VRILVSAGEASGDMYAARMVRALHKYYGSATYFGCTGPRLKEASVETVVDSAKLSVVGLAEVAGHLPGIYREYRKLIHFLREDPPDAAVLTDSPDFHLRLARHLRAMGVPVFYLVAPQVWAWRQGRVRQIRERVRKLFCLFPFEEEWFRSRGVDATYIGHPLATAARPTWTRNEFRARHGLKEEISTVAVLPGSRAGEAGRHMPDLLGALRILRRKFPLQILLATPKGFAERQIFATFREPIRELAIKIIEDETWDVLANADLALAASGTVTVEAAVLGTPMVTYYKVTSASWWAGRRLVKVPYLSMVNLIAGHLAVPELIQHEMTPVKLADAASPLLADPRNAARMRQDLAAVKAKLTAQFDPFERAASLMAAELGHSRNQA
jgi:lipid-A-disaccharide synthase